MVKKKVEFETHLETIEENTEINKKTNTEIKKKYDRYIPKHDYRKTIYLKFLELLNNFYKIYPNIKLYPKENTDLENLQKMALNLEKAIFNYTLYIHPTTEWNDEFKNWYHQKLVVIYTNLNPDSYLKNNNLIIRYFAREFTEEQLIYYNGDRLFPEKYNEYYNEYIKSLPGQQEKIEIPDGMFKCIYCARDKKPAYKTTYYQLQTRSADEPMTTFHSCLQCGKRWKS